MITDQDQAFLCHALSLAMNGRGIVEPNPMVGCVLALDGKVVGEGWHLRFGGAHAEPTALADAKSRGESVAGATAYVTLEPCCHLNKKTPPCAPRLIQAGISRVVVGCLDPNPDVNGKGVAMLRDAGVSVDLLPEEQDPSWAHGSLNALHFKQLIAPFLLLQREHRPYVTVKWAQTADGKIAGPGGARFQISNSQSTRFVHQLRANTDAIMVAAATVLNDDPQLNVRGVPNVRLGQVFVLDTHARTPVTAKVLGNPDVTLVHRSDLNEPAALARLERLRTFGPTLRTRTLEVDAAGRLRLDRLFTLPDFRPGHLLVETGPTLACAFFDANLCDRLLVTYSSKRVDDATAPDACAIPPHFVRSGTIRLGDDLVTEYFNSRGPAYFTATPSADLVLTSLEYGSPLMT